MNIDELKNIILPYIEEPIVNFEIKRQIFIEINGRKIYNQIIRDRVDKRFGIYVWVDKTKSEVVYIGMAGKIKTNGSIGSHSVQQRLLASRDIDKVSEKDIQTIDSLEFFIMYSKKDEPPAYLEALLLYKYYKKNKKLPKLNNSF